MIDWVFLAWSQALENVVERPAGFVFPIKWCPWMFSFKSAAWGLMLGSLYVVFERVCVKLMESWPLVWVNPVSEWPNLDHLHKIGQNPGMNSGELHFRTLAFLSWCPIVKKINYKGKSLINQNVSSFFSLFFSKSFSNLFLLKSHRVASARIM